MATFHLTGPCKITFDSVVLGKTKAGVTLRPRVTWNPVIVDKFGASPAGYIYAGKSCVVEAALAEFNVTGEEGFQKIKKEWLPGGLLGYLQSDTGDPCLIGETALTAKGSEGTGTGIYRTLQIDELVSGKSWVANVAILMDPGELALTSTTEQLVPVSFIVLPDANNYLFATQEYLRAQA